MKARVNRNLRFRLSSPWLAGQRLLNRVLRPFSAKSFRVLMFHDVPKQQMAAFERLVQHVLQDYGVITPSEVEERALQARGLQGPPRFDRSASPCLFTFDDGFKSNLHVGRLLAWYQVRAVFFVCPGLMELPRAEQGEAIANRIFRESGASARGLKLTMMNWDDLAELQKLGHTFGAHTLYHCCVADLGGVELNAEVATCGDLLAHKLGANIDWFAYPFGSVGSVNKVALQVIARRYRICVSGVRGVNDERTHPLGLYRENVELDTPLTYQQLTVAGGFDLLYARDRRVLKMMLSGIRPRAETGHLDGGPNSC